MAINIGATTACLTTQQVLKDIAQSNLPTHKITAPGLLQAITSPSNTSGFEVIEGDDRQGRNTTIEVAYWQNPRTAASTSRADICTKGTTIGKKYATISTPLENSVSLTLSEPEFRAFCNESNTSDITTSDFALQQIKGLMNQLLAGINAQATTYAVAHAGNFYNAIAGPKTVLLIKSDGSNAHSGEIDIITDMEDLDNPLTPFAVGSGYLRTYVKQASITCCNNTGINVSNFSASSFNYFFDRGIEAATPGQTQDFLVLHPGALQIVPNLRWRGPYDDAINGTARKDQLKTNITLPVPGGGTLPIDMTVYRSFCDDNNNGDTSWVLTWGLRYGFYDLPANVEAVGSPYSGVNNIFHYIGSCGDETCADVES